MSQINFHLYKKERGLNYNYVDRVVKNYVDMGGVILNIYPLIGAIKSDGSVVDIETSGESIVSDAVLNENSKRKYSHVTFDLYACTKMNTPKYSWLFSGLSTLDGDEKEFSVHYNSMIETLGRKIIVGDVIEMTWMRDLDVIGKDTGVNKFFVVSASERDENGWGPEWGYHLWKLKCKPITNSPEYSDLFNNDEVDPEDPFYEDINSANGGGGIDISNSQDDNLLETNDAVLEEVEKCFSYRMHDEHHVFLDKNMNLYIDEKPNIVGIDGIPAELTCEEINYGTFFPSESKDGDYFLRIDYDPPCLYRRIIDGESKKWVLIEKDRRPLWRGVPDVLLNIINNENTFVNEMGETVNMRENIKNLVPARVKKEHNNPRPWSKELQQEIKENTGVEYPIIGMKYPSSSD